MGIVNRIRAALGLAARTADEGVAQPRFDDIEDAGVLEDSRRASAIKNQLLLELDRPQRGGLLWETQIGFAYDSSRIEGITLTEEQTRQLYETRSIEGGASLDDIIAVNNHFLMFEHMLRTIDEPLTKDLLLRFNGILSSRSSGDLSDHRETGSFKTMANGVGDVRTTPPDMTEAAIDNLLARYAAAPKHGYEQMAAFHITFETIHPFPDGNGRVGRLVMFRECLRSGLVPPVITDARKAEYYHALREAPETLVPLVECIESAASMYLRSAEPLVMTELLDGVERAVELRDPSLDLTEASELLAGARWTGNDVGVSPTVEDAMRDEVAGSGRDLLA